MIDTYPNTVSEFNEQVIAEFRANGGRVGGALASTPMLLLHHFGAKSRTEHITPLAYTPHGNGTFVIVASNGGSPTHPSWYYNLKANPTIEVEVGTDRFRALAVELEGTARTSLWPKLIEAAPSIGQFQAQTTRRIPVFVLSRESPPDPSMGRPLSSSEDRRGRDRLGDDGLTRRGERFPVKSSVCSVAAPRARSDPEGSGRHKIRE